MSPMFLKLAITVVVTIVLCFTVNPVMGVVAPIPVLIIVEIIGHFIKKTALESLDRDIEQNRLKKEAEKRVEERKRGPERNLQIEEEYRAKYRVDPRHPEKSVWVQQKYIEYFKLEYALWEFVGKTTNRHGYSNIHSSAEEYGWNVASEHMLYDAAAFPSTLYKSSLEDFDPSRYVTKIWSVFLNHLDQWIEITKATGYPYLYWFHVQAPDGSPYPMYTIEAYNAATDMAIWKSFVDKNGWPHDEAYHVPNLLNKMRSYFGDANVEESEVDEVDIVENE